MAKIIGIELGTTNSRVAVMEGGRPKIIANSSGDTATPSIVAFTKDGQVLVGESAKRQAVTNARNTLFAVKRLIGRKFDDEVVRRDIRMVPYKIVKADNGDAWVEVQGKEMAPPEISALVLMEMKKTAADYLGEAVTDAVITVPAFFNDSQRQATKDAARIAGLNVKRIINEPTAAALAFGLDREGGNRKIAVYDLGGGTFSISVIEIDQVDGELQVEVLSTNGDAFLGGEDFDLCVVNYLCDQFKKKNGIDLRKDPLALQPLKEAAEKAKIELSSSQQTNIKINLPHFTVFAAGVSMLSSIELTRAKLESLVEDLVRKTIAPCKTAMKDAGVSSKDLTDVILVGAQTRMPLVQKYVRDLFGKPPRNDVNPDEAVAVGAAIQAGVLSGDIKDVLLLDVTPLSLGIETLGGLMTKLIEKNSTIPTKASQTFSTADDNQTAVTIHVLQGERDRASENKSLGKFDVTDIPPAPRGVPMIEVSFDIDANGILKVSAKHLQTGKQQQIKVNASGGLSESQIDRMVADAEKYVAEDRKFRELLDARNKADATIHAVEKTVKDLGNKVEAGERAKVESTIADLRTALKGDDKDVIEKKTEALAQASASIAQRTYAASTGARDQADAMLNEATEELPDVEDTPSAARQQKASSPSIFLSYRRDDSADVSGRIYDRLVQRFTKEKVFKDVDSIPLGIDFRQHLVAAVGECSVVLAVIGRNWLGQPSPPGKRRIDDPRDFVRIELEAALARRIPLIPVLVQGADVPSDTELPPGLLDLAYRHGTKVRPDPDFHNDMDRLIRSLEGLLR
jgi:molecular chaperone DnaK